MVGEPWKAFIQAVNISCVIVLAGVYVFTYYDYLHTMTQNGGVYIAGTPSPYKNAQVGVVTIDQ